MLRTVTQIYMQLSASRGLGGRGGGEGGGEEAAQVRILETGFYHLRDLSLALFEAFPGQPQTHMSMQLPRCFKLAIIVKKMCQWGRWNPNLSRSSRAPVVKY